MPETLAIKRAKKLKSIATAVVDNLPDSHFKEDLSFENIALMRDMAMSPRECLPGQVAPVLALTKGLMSYNVAVLLAEMGTGKTQMSIETMNQVLQQMKGNKGSSQKALFLTVGKLMRKMTREAYEILGKKRVKVFEIISAYKYEMNTDGSPKRFKKDTKKKDRYGKNIQYYGPRDENNNLGDLVPIKMTSMQVFADEVIDMVVPDGLIYLYMISKDSAKLTMGTEFVMEWGDRCLECNEFLLKKEYGMKNPTQSIKWKLKQNMKAVGKPLNCPHCGASCEAPVTKNLATASNPIFPHMVDKRIGKKGSRKISIGKKFRNQLDKRKGRHIFDLIVVDEVHEMQSPESIQGLLYRDLVNVSKKALIMTGTLSNGYPSSIFYILQGVMPNYLRREGFKFYDVNRFVDRYGALKSTKTADVIKKVGSRTQIRVDELPRISEGIVSLLAPYTYWLKMEDLNLPMPSYREDPYVVEMDKEVKDTLDAFRSEVTAAISKYDPKRMKSFAQRFVYLQNNPTFPFTYEFEANVIQFDETLGEEVIAKKEFSFEFKPVDADKVYAKEQRLINYIKGELSAGRNVMVYSIHNKAAKISERLGKVISEAIEGITLKVMPESVGGDKIEPWIEKNPCDVLVCSPLKVSTGLDLVQFPTIAFYETGTNLRVVQQASRRSWRAFGQDFPVKVAFFAYQGIQAKLLDLLGKKLKGAAIVEGRAVEAGQLASIFDEDADFTEALNNIAKELEEDIKPDFSSSIIEEGKMRPNTKFEQAYIDILHALRDINEDDMDYDFKNRHENDDIEDYADEEEVIDITETLSEPSPDEEDISTIEIVDTEPKLNENENVACKCENKQLSFNF